MPDFKSNKGITLVELIVTIAIGSVITLAVVTLLLLGLRFHRKSTDTALRQNEIQVAVTLMEKLIAENAVIGLEEGKILIPGETEKKELLYLDTNNSAILCCSNILASWNE